MIFVDFVPYKTLISSLDIANIFMPLNNLYKYVASVDNELQYMQQKFLKNKNDNSKRNFIIVKFEC